MVEQKNGIEKRMSESSVEMNGRCGAEFARVVQFPIVWISAGRGVEANDRKRIA